MLSTAIEQLSVAVANPVESGSVDWVQSTVTSAGHTISGAVVSTTLIICVQTTRFPQSSSAIHVLSIENVPSHNPSITTSSYVIFVISNVQLSVAVAIPVLEGSVLSLHSIVMSSGQVITGGVVSSTVIT